MRSFGDASEQLSQARRSFEREWDRTASAWHDARRDEFERTTVLPTVRDAIAMVRDMERSEELVAAALARL